MIPTKPFVASVLISALAFSASARDGRTSVAEESWTTRRIDGTQVETELPSGGKTVRRLHKDSAVTMKDSVMLGEQLTFDDWPTGEWKSSIRLDEYTVAAGSSDPKKPRQDEWAYGLTDHTGKDSEPKSAWEAPKIEKRQGYRVYESARNLTILGEPVVWVDYHVELGPRKQLLIGLSCSKADFKRYAPYYVRIRDGLRLPKKGASSAESK